LPDFLSSLPHLKLSTWYFKKILQGQDVLQPNTGKHYFEICVERTAASMIFVGFWDNSDIGFLETYFNSNAYTICLSSGEIFRNSTQQSFLERCFQPKQRLGLLFDSNAGIINAYVS
jgi:hypothetical protein